MRERKLPRRDQRFVRLRVAIFVARRRAGHLCVWVTRNTFHGGGSPFRQSCSSGCCRFIRRASDGSSSEGHRRSFMPVVCGDWTVNSEPTSPTVQNSQMICIHGHRIWMSSAQVRCFSCSTNAARSPVAESWRNGCRHVCDGDTIRLRQARAQGLKNELVLRESLACIPDSAQWATAERLLMEWVQESASAHAVVDRRVVAADRCVCDSRHRAGSDWTFCH